MSIRRLIEQKTGLRTEIPPAVIEADLTIPCFAADPQKIAEKIRGLDSLIAEVKIAGRYVNIIFDKERLAAGVLKQIEKEKNQYGSSKIGRLRKIIVEYSQPNVAKPLSVGHLRATLVGQVLKNLYDFQGYKTIGINHIGDWGTQFGKLLVAYDKWPKERRNLFHLYVKFHEEAKKNPVLEDEARTAFGQLEKGNKNYREIWKKIVSDSLKEFNKIYKLLGVKFDHTTGESFYHKLVPAVIEEAVKKETAKPSEGAIIVPEETTGLPTFVIQKKDEATIYAGRDLAAARYRLKKFRPDKIIYVTGSEQELYFRQIFKALELLGQRREKFEHVSFGLVRLAEGRMATREGRVILLNDLIKEAIKRAKNETVGLGAIIYNVLAVSREKTVVFDWQKMLNLRGNSAPYLLYVYARCRSILRKLKNPGARIKSTNQNLKLTDSETKLIKLSAGFPDICERAQKERAPHLVANYLNELAQEFNRFYEKEPVLKAPDDVRNFRLRLVSAVAQIMKNGLGLLNIKTLEKL